MLETEEVDVDYFTPASSTSLAKIFSNNTLAEEENKSLKYIPPLPTQVTKKPEEEKPTQCIYATALYAYEWLKNSYVSKEKVGFAIMKVTKSGAHNIVLYDSNKTTLSCLTLTTTTEIHVKENVSLSYYDNQQKYWNVYTTPFELNKILDILKGLNVCFKHLEVAQPVVSDKDELDNKQNVPEAINKMYQIPPQLGNKGSDTDSSVNRRTKDSILRRMATMGHSVLPPTHITTAQTSDSSDTNGSNSQQKTRHKPVKINNRRSSDRNIDFDSQEQIKHVTSRPVLSADMHGMYSNTDQQLVAIKTLDLVRNPVSSVAESNNDMNLFMSEQRVSNSELRINLSRMTDKLDLVLDKVKTLEHADKSSPGSNTSQFQNDIIHKLLKEYETKIKKYEEFIRLKGFSHETFASIDQQDNIRNNEINEVQCNCKHLCEERDREIYQLKEQIKLLSTKLEDTEIKSKTSSSSKEIDDLKLTINMRDDQIVCLNKEIESALSNKDVTNKLKEIMNDVFQNIMANFDSETSYSNANIKSVVASVIKKTTMESLRDLK